MNNLYLILDAVTIGLPFLLSFDKKVAFYKTWKHLFPGILVSGVIFIAWDVWFTKEGVWGFNPDYLVGIDVFGLPLEECLFFLVVPYSCVFIYACVNAYLKEGVFANSGNKIAIALGLALFMTGLFFYDRWYTAITFVGLGGYLLYLGAITKPKWIGRFFQSFLIVLIPFFIVNGVLTGTGIEEQVVWYNEVHIIGPRLGTIPIEDPFYGMFLLLITTHIYEGLQRRN